MIVTVLRAFVAGFFVGNGPPHFVEGSTGRTVDPGPFGEGAVVNVVSGWFLMLIGALAWNSPTSPPTRGRPGRQRHWVCSPSG